MRVGVVIASAIACACVPRVAEHLLPERENP